MTRRDPYAKMLPPYRAIRSPLVSYGTNAVMVFARCGTQTNRRIQLLHRLQRLILAEQQITPGPTAGAFAVERLPDELVEEG